MKDYKDADLRGFNFFEVDLSNADLRGADLRGADLRRASIKGAKTQGIKTDATTKLPHFPVSPKSGNENDFWANINKGEHWIWEGQTNNNHNTVDCESYDYGVFQLEGCLTQLVHRIIYYIKTGSELEREVEVTTLCGNHLCVNPEHLGLVDSRIRKDRQENSINMGDMINGL